MDQSLFEFNVTVMPILMYVIMAFLIAHLIGNALTSRRWNAWLLLIGVVLLTTGIVATVVRSDYKFKSQDIQKQTISKERDEPYWSIMATVRMVGALLIIVGLGTEVGKQVGGAWRDRRIGQARRTEDSDSFKTHE